MNPKGPLPCLFHHTGCTARHTVGHSQPATSITPLPLEIIPINKALTLLPEKTDLVAFAPPLLGINSEEGKLFPVVHPSQFMSPYLWQKLLLHSLYLIDRGLVPWGPELAAMWKEKKISYPPLYMQQCIRNFWCLPSRRKEISYPPLYMQLCIANFWCLSSRRKEMYCRLIYKQMDKGDLV